ncbi:MAG: hypothetical protein KBT70_13510 [Roseovarius sp.]|uniref:hypothetical protein n=1 Tax=Roseovarius sp. TaxID=1486281 RepID=UPI001B6B0EC0|nr:hypothetical protein [Roseovarius sp.]MBQ0751204.1 hypothetical protein [Roseovarius sp.]
MSNLQMIVTCAACKKPKNKKTSIVAVAQIFALFFLLISIPQVSRAEEYKIPQFVVDACIIASPFIAAAQIATSTPTSSDDVLSNIVDLKSLYDTLNNELVTPEKCRTVLPQAIADLDLYMFRQSLKLCTDAEISALGTDYTRGGWYCSTLSAEDWRQFREWLPTEEGQAWIKERTGLTAEDVFVPSPAFDVSQYLDTPAALDGWYLVGSGGAITNDIGFQLTAVCEGNATLLLT